MNEQIDLLKNNGFFDVKNGSVEVFFDDVGIIQKLIVRERGRKRNGEDFKILNKPNTKVTANFNMEGQLGQVEYERHIYTKIKLTQQQQ